jgi:hypothetical protein
MTTQVPAQFQFEEEAPESPNTTEVVGLGERPLLPEKVAEAKQLLNGMTAEKLAHLLMIVEEAETQLATGAEPLAWMSGQVFSKSGAEYKLSVGAAGPINALDKMGLALEYAAKRYGMVTKRPGLQQAPTTAAASNGGTPPPTAAPAAKTAAPAAVGATGTATAGAHVDGEFDAAELVGSTNAGKTYWKVKGGRFTQYGVTVWPEVLTAAGFDAAALDPARIYDLTGYKALYANKADGSGKPDKVTALAKAA